MKTRIIFTLTTGRSGTALLAKLLEPLPQVHAEHEPKPLFSDAFVYLKTRPGFDVDKFCHDKINAIKTIILESNRSIYIETCHTFGKGFIEPMCRLLSSEVEIIILHRDPMDVAMSMYRLGDIPGRTKTGIHWYISPTDFLSLTHLTRPMTDYTDFQLCYWYTQEMLCRMNHALRHHQILATIEFRELLSYHYFHNILKRMKLEIPRNYHAYYKSITLTKINEKTHRKHPLSLPVDYQEQIDQVHQDLIIK